MARKVIYPAAEELIHHKKQRKLQEQEQQHQEQGTSTQAGRPPRGKLVVLILCETSLDNMYCMFDNRRQTERFPASEKR